jgi:hypothetical protein
MLCVYSGKKKSTYNTEMVYIILIVGLFLLANANLCSLSREVHCYKLLIHLSLQNY